MLRELKKNYGCYKLHIKAQIISNFFVKKKKEKGNFIKLKIPLVRRKILVSLRLIYLLSSIIVTLNYSNKNIIFLYSFCFLSPVILLPLVKDNMNSYINCAFLNAKYFARFTP